MDYRIDPTPIGRRSSRRLLAVTAIVVGVFGVAIGGLALGGRQDPQVASGAVASTPTNAAIATSPTPPPETRCHGVTARRCARIADAALGAIVDPSLPQATTVDVWASLVCGDTFDCPPGHMSDRRPVGSTVVGLADALALWVNVSDRLDDPTTHESDPMLDAWVIRSTRGD